MGRLSKKLKTDNEPIVEDIEEEEEEDKQEEQVMEPVARKLHMSSTKSRDQSTS
jgi:tetrahydromethanopterin S-methyltransferase subunit A